jgi:hypothetical protein
MSKEDFASAINQVLQTISKEKAAKTIDMELFTNNCIREFGLLDFPFYSIAVDKVNDKKIVIETPFLNSCHILIAQYLFGSRDKAAVLFVNGKPVRKIRLEDTNPEYMARIAHALLDYLKRYVLLKNKFLQ